jgi:hypothetical protein
VPKFMMPVPAHVACNNRFSDDNDYFRDILVVEAGANQHPEAKRILEGKIIRKLRNKPGKIKKLLKNLRLIPERTPSGIWTGDDLPVFDVDWPRMERVMCNFADVFFLTMGKLMPQDFLIEAHAVTSEKFVEHVRPVIGI